MYRLLFCLMMLLAIRSFGADTAEVVCPLKGYRKWFYKLVILHPQINSKVERQLLQHYLCGSGTVFLLTDSDFDRLQDLVRQRNAPAQQSLSSAAPFCAATVSLDDDGYFGWGLGSVICVFDRGCQRMITFADRYDFNTKKWGKRKLKLELYTRLFRWMAPHGARPFLVSYGGRASGYTQTDLKRSGTL